MAGTAVRGRPSGWRRLELPLVGAAAIVITLGYVVVANRGSSPGSPGWADRFPVQVAETFEFPFTYAIDPASGLDLDPGSSQLYQFRVHDATNPSRSSRIVAVRVADTINRDPCHPAVQDTVDIAGAAPFVDYLRSIPGLLVSAPIATTVDGRPALQVHVIDRPQSDCPDVHIWPGESAFTATAAARRLEAFEVDGTTILVVAAVADASDLDAWLPTADAFIATLHFQSNAQSGRP